MNQQLRIVSDGTSDQTHIIDRDGVDLVQKYLINEVKIHITPEGGCRAIVEFDNVALGEFPKDDWAQTGESI